MYGAGSDVRAPYKGLETWLETVSVDELAKRHGAAELAFRKLGITFAVYGDNEGDEKIIPFDVLPRIVAAEEFDALEAGIVQRIDALQMFLADIYGPREILKAGLIPEELVLSNPQFQPIMTQIKPPGGVYSHISGIDMVRTADEFYVLEDNLRTPSGVAYMLENREAMLRLFPMLFQEHSIRPVESYIDYLQDMIRAVAPEATRGDPTGVILTPGPLNSAYYEHSFLADRLGIELVEGSDLFVEDRCVYMRTTKGPERVDVVYRRIDDDYLDPLAFRPDSILGIAGMMDAYEAGNVTIINAPGTGVADDKAIYSYVPEIVKFYSGSDAALKNVETYRCREDDALKYTLDNLAELVVKRVDASGGYGMLIGPAATEAEIEEFALRIKDDPDGYIAQPTLALSTCPTVVNDSIVERHVDLRAFVVSGAEETKVVPGGLTRVALKEGSLVVNSSQGGGTKDSWVLAS
ncbi:circularly permuted type 2 ATP-grasp protein [Pacificimonas pallii]|nr:circularly permuted type 2 ATP-grasp protein [Pacificimonas pallii]